MTLSKIVLLSLFSVQLIAIHADALKCFRCNSNDNPDCFNVHHSIIPATLAPLVVSPKSVDNSTATTTTTTTASTPTNSTPTGGPPSPKPQQSQPQELLQECGLDDKGRQPFCRKISVTVLNNQHHRVIRECGYERSATNCYKADNEDHLETVCQCWTDGCNGVAGLRRGCLGMLTVMALLLLASLLV